MSSALPCFTAEEKAKAHALLAIRVAHMMGRKFEEGDWSHVYCRSKGIAERGWSNLDIDVMHQNFGIEHKMLCFRSKPSIEEACGTTLMHPSATRSIRTPPLDTDPNEAMADVLTQYAHLIRERARKVSEQNYTDQEVDMRTGWLLWQQSLRQFLYFEEPMSEPDPSLYYAEWVERESGSGARKGSKNLWIYERDSGRKRYSVTTSAGAKIQPYFDIPPPNDPNLYIFTVIGEQLNLGEIRIWLTLSTKNDLLRVVGSLEEGAINKLILDTAKDVRVAEAHSVMIEEPGYQLHLTVNAYQALKTSFPGVSDEHSMRLLIEQLQL